MTPSTKRILSGVLVLASFAVSSLITMDVIAAAKWIKLATWGASVLTAAVAMLPSLFGDAAIPVVPPRIADAASKVAVLALLLTASGCAHDPAAGTGCTGGEIAGGGAFLAVFVAVVWLLWQRNRIGKLAIAFALFAGAAHAQHAGPFYALAGDVLVIPPPPVEDPGRVVAQAAPVVSDPVPNGAHGADVAAVQPQGSAQPVALNPLAPLVPPAPSQPSSSCKCDKAFYAQIISAAGASIVVPFLTWVAVHFTAPTPMGTQP